MKEEDLEKFTDDIFKDEQLDEVSSNFDYLVLQKIQNETLQLSFQPILSPFKWILIGLFILFIMVAGFYFNTGSSSGNVGKINRIVSSYLSIELNPIVLIGVVALGLFVLFQVLFLRRMHSRKFEV